MSKTSRRKILNPRSRSTSRPLPTVQPRYRPTNSTAFQPSDLQALAIASVILGTISLFILATEYQWARELFGFIILVFFFAYLLTGIMNS